MNSVSRDAPAGTARDAYSATPRRLGIDTHHEPVVYLRRDSPICRAEGFEAHSRVEVRVGERRILATLNMVLDAMLGDDEAGLSERAWNLLAPAPGQLACFAHPRPVESMGHVRAKIYGAHLDEGRFDAILRDAVDSRLSNVELSAFLAACAGGRLGAAETTALTRAMVHVGNRLSWSHEIVVDKHCVGGLPGNRTTPIVVAVACALGLVMPKTSSRAITSPAGTADTMETLAPVDLSLAAMRRVVEREGGCVVWGGAMGLSPADDTLIRVERQLDLDSEGQLVASVLSKKVAAGSTHVVLDLPVGPTAKVRGQAEAQALAHALRRTGHALGLHVRTLFSDGTQPVGRGIGPALEAHDVLAVLRNEADAPDDLRQRALTLAASVVELAGLAIGADAHALAAATLADGRAWARFQAICEAQGGLRTPGRASYTQPVAAPHAGRIAAIDNRLLARAAKLAGAPHDPLAGLLLQARVGDRVDAGQPLFVLHAESPGELAYAMDFVAAHPAIVHLESQDSP